MKKTILIGALALALGACSEQVKEEGQVIKVDIADARPIAGNWDFALDFSRKCLFFGLDFSRILSFFGLDFSKKSLFYLIFSTYPYLCKIQSNKDIFFTQKRT